jgi:hypothetical protein
MYFHMICETFYIYFRFGFQMSIYSLGAGFKMVDCVDRSGIPTKQKYNPDFVETFDSLKSQVVILYF